MRIIDPINIITEHIYNGKYVIGQYETYELRTLTEFMDMFFDKQAEKERLEAARVSYEKRKENIARNKRNK